MDQGADALGAEGVLIPPDEYETIRRKLRRLAALETGLAIIDGVIGGNRRPPADSQATTVPT